MACFILGAIIGGLLFGELVTHHKPLLAAITVICSFGIGCCIIVILDQFEER